MIKRVPIQDFIKLSSGQYIIDVRSPGEYSHACIPGAYPLPLFTDEERKMVGTAYKQKGRQPAIKLGLNYFGPKMTAMVETIEKMIRESKENGGSEKDNGTLVGKRLFIYCWRGGMRSAGVAWLMDLYGFEVYTLVGGYKAYRNWVLQQLEKDYNLNIV